MTVTEAARATRAAGPAAAELHACLGDALAALEVTAAALTLIAPGRGFGGGVARRLPELKDGTGRRPGEGTRLIRPAFEEET